MAQGLRELRVSRGRNFIDAWTEAAMASTQTQDEDGNEDEGDDNQDEEDDNGDDDGPGFVKTRTQTRVSLFPRTSLTSSSC